MNFLQLVNRARRECGAASADLSTLQGSLVLDDRRFKDWVAEAWRDVQTRKPDWDWLDTEFSFNTEASKGTYTGVEATQGEVNAWKVETLRTSTAGSGFADEQFLPYMDYSDFRDVYVMGPQRAQPGRPKAFSVDAKKRLVLGPVPDAAYTVVGEYFKTAQDLTLDADTPAMPEQFHMLVVWLACMQYGHYEAAPEVIQRADVESRRILNRLFADQMPDFMAGPTLA